MAFFVSVSSAPKAPMREHALRMEGGRHGGREGGRVGEREGGIEEWMSGCSHF